MDAPTLEFPMRRTLRFGVEDGSIVILFPLIGKGYEDDEVIDVIKMDLAGWCPAVQ